jgi:hypothetical protein
MNATLTQEQLQVLATANGETLRLIDPQTNEVYVLIKENVYVQVVGQAPEDDSPEEYGGMLLEEALWDDDVSDSHMDS